QPVLVHQLHRAFVLAVLRSLARSVADRWPHRRADGLLRVPARDPAPAARGGRARVQRAPLERHAEGRPFRGNGAARRTGAGDPRVLPVLALRAVALPYGPRQRTLNGAE